ncbi:MAG: hypothetical protein AB7S78_09365 [Candidatus Omnitrophota bacterium]
MKQNQISQCISFFVILSGVCVMTGWIFDIGLLKSILPFWISMKFTTAVCFAASGLTLLSIREYLQQKTFYHQIVLPVTCLIIFLLMMTMLLGTMFQIDTGMESFFVKDHDDPIMTTVPGRPSVGTMIAFLLVGLTGVFTEFKTARLVQKLQLLGIGITIIGSVALIGYIANLPALYYYVKEVSSAMAFNTAVLFVLLGAGFLSLKESA